VLLPSEEAAVWLLYLTLLLFIATTVLVYSFVEPLEEARDWADAPRDWRADAAPTSGNAPRGAGAVATRL
jgi:hypothetical protein